MKAPLVPLSLLVSGCRQPNPQHIGASTSLPRAVAVETKGGEIPSSPTTNVLYDLPSLLNLDFAAVTAHLGEPATREMATLPDKEGMSATWKKRDGSTLTIYFAPLSKKPFLLALTFPQNRRTTDKKRAMERGHLSVDDARYAVSFVAQRGDASQIAGVKVMPAALK